MGLLSHPHRKQRLHVLTMDPVLSEDVCARLAEDPRTRDVERVAPRGDRIAVEDIVAVAAIIGLQAIEYRKLYPLRENESH